MIGAGACRLEKRNVTIGSRYMLLNVVMNLAGNFAVVLLGIITIPHIVGSFGVASYGLWTLVAVSTGLLAILELGVAGATSRLLAFNRERPDATRPAVILSTGICILGVVGLAVLGLALLLPHVFFLVYSVPVAQVADVRLALLLSGANVAIGLAGAVCHGYLWSRERFDIVNMVEITVGIIRTAAIFQLIGPGSALSELAIIQLVLSLVTQTFLLVACRWIVGGFHIDPRLFEARVAREIYSVGIWYFILSSSRNYLPQLAGMMIGHRLSSTHVATYAIASQLAGYTRAVANDATQVVAPRAAALHGASRAAGALALFLEGGRLATALSLLLVGGVLSLGQPFIHVWQHGRLDAAYLPLVVLVIGELAAMSQAVTYSSVMAAGRMKMLAALALGEVVLMLVLAFLLVEPFGVMGAAVAVAVPAFLLRGVGRWIYGCRLMGMSLAGYCGQVLLPAGLSGLAGVVAGTVVVNWLAPSTWPGLVVAGGAYVLAFVICAGPALLRGAVRNLLPGGAASQALRKAR